MKKVTAHIPEVYAPLMQSQHRIKFYYGGRAGGKSYAFADSLLILGRQKKLFIACLREVQDSIKDSVYKLLSDRIAFYGLSDYRVYEDRIDNKITGTRFIFKGLRDQDAQKIKSLEGVDIAWIEEAQTISQNSWEVLEPTIRKDGSQIWVSMNRLYETDALWNLIAQNPDERTLVRRVNYYDNPFCPNEIKIQAQKCKQKDLEKYNHIWLGGPMLQGNDKLISSSLVHRAFEKTISSTTSPLVIGLDIAGFGDDKTTFCFRKGRLCSHFETFEKLDNVEVANLATNFINTYKPVRLFMDIGGQGAGVFDILKDRGYGPIIRGIYFGQKAIRPDRYFNKRAEMWDKIAIWLAEDPQPQIPEDEVLFSELTLVAKKYDSRGRLQLQGKEDLKKQLGRSPDKADALALTFAEPIYDYGLPKFYNNGKLSIEDMFGSQNKPQGANW